MAVGEFALPANNPSGGGGTYSTVLREYTTSGTWTKPTGLLFIEIVCIGGGGGGACGGRQASGIASRAGGGAGCGGFTYSNILASSLGATETYTIGTGGLGAAARGTDNAAGANGSAGGNTTFGLLATAVGGSAGSATTNPGAKISGTRYTEFSKWLIGQNSDSNSNGTTAGTPNTESAFNQNWLAASSAGAGGGVTTANVASNGSPGPRQFNTAAALNTAPAAGIASGGNGGNGVDNYVNRYFGATMLNATPTKFAGTGAAGGAGHAAGDAGSGGNGGLYGGAGGGGGGSRNGFLSGKGGDGGGGLIVILEHIVS